MSINNRLKELRKLMVNNEMDAYIINTSDPHGSEYLADRYKSREWISGFTGSAGTVVVTKDKALLWTDGRYFIQAENQIRDSEFEMYKIGIPGYPTYWEWIKENLGKNIVIGFDGEVFSQSEYANLKNEFKEIGVKFISEKDLIDEIWIDRPKAPMTKAFVHEVKYTGKTAKEKVEEVRDMMEKEEVDYFVISTLDDIAWLFNIRGRDVLNNPVVFSYALISKNEAILFVENEKLGEDVLNHLNKNDIMIKSYEAIRDEVAKLDKNKTMYVESNRLNRAVYSSIPKNMKIKSGINYTTNLKARKNKTEIENQRNAYLKDGVAITKFLCWLDMNVGKEEITEISAAKKLLEFREEQEGFVEPSFDTISAYKDNAAMMHYSATKETDRILKKEGLYLVDSGGQYFDGTTDTTRTVALGKITEEEKRDCTLTFKGHTMLLDAKFLYGATGHSLDALARYPLWQEGSDYKCGTGHGIGFMLNVHEGPQNIAPASRFNSVVLEEGMIISIEPGVYKTGKHGIRLENIVVVEKHIENDSGQFMKFDVLSFVPIDLRTIEVSMLNEKEINWLNKYHEKVYEKLSPFMNKEENEWLKNQTRKI